MNNFIELTYFGQKAVFNINQIKAMFADRSGKTIIDLGHPESKYLVKESYEEIIAKLSIIKLK